MLSLLDTGPAVVPYKPVFKDLKKKKCCYNRCNLFAKWFAKIFRMAAWSQGRWQIPVILGAETGGP